MKIVIDARQIINSPTGGETVLYNVFKYILSRDKENEYVFFLNKNLNENNRIFSLKQVNVRFRKVLIGEGAFSKSVLQQVIVPFYLFSEKPDVYFYPLQDLPFLHPYRTVVAIYDLKRIFLPTENLSSWFMKIYTMLITKITIWKANCIICISDNTMKDLARIGKAKDLQMIYLGVSDKFRLLKKGNPKEKFILTVGENRPHKNIQILINAFKRLQGDKDFDYKLFIVGPGFDAREEDGIKYFGVVPDEKLVELYNAAGIFVFPSLYEGFGLPIIEAMACGCPVIASNRSSVPEACGNAAIIIDPNEDELAKTIKELIKNKKLRNELRHRGLERAKSFGWDKTAEEWYGILTKNEK